MYTIDIDTSACLEDPSIEIRVVYLVVFMAVVAIRLSLTTK